LNDWWISSRHRRADPGCRITDPDVDVAARLGAADLTADALILTVYDDLVAASRITASRR